MQYNLIEGDPFNSRCIYRSKLYGIFLSTACVSHMAVFVCLRTCMCLCLCLCFVCLRACMCIGIWLLFHDDKRHRCAYWNNIQRDKNICSLCFLTNALYFFAPQTIARIHNIKIKCVRLCSKFDENKQIIICTHRHTQAHTN